MVSNHICMLSLNSDSFLGDCHLKRQLCFLSITVICWLELGYHQLPWFASIVFPVVLPPGCSDRNSADRRRLIFLKHWKSYWVVGFEPSRSTFCHKNNLHHLGRQLGELPQVLAADTGGSGDSQSSQESSSVRTLDQHRLHPSVFTTTLAEFVSQGSWQWLWARWSCHLSEHLRTRWTWIRCQAQLPGLGRTNKRRGPGNGFPRKVVCWLNSSMCQTLIQPQQFDGSCGVQ